MRRPGKVALVNGIQLCVEGKVGVIGPRRRLKALALLVDFERALVVVQVASLQILDLLLGGRLASQLVRGVARRIEVVLATIDLGSHLKK